MTATITTTTVLVAGLNTPASEKTPRTLNWTDAMTGLALSTNGVEIDANLMPQVRYLWAEDYRITTVPNPDTGKVRVLFTPLEDEEEYAQRTVLVGTGKYKGATVSKF